MRTLGFRSAPEKDFVGWGHIIQAWNGYGAEHLRYLFAVVEEGS